MKWFLDLAGLTAPQVNDLIDRANLLDQFPQPDALAGKILTLLLLKPSFHTRVSMEAAMARLGGRTITIAPALDGWRIETGDDVVMDGDTAHHSREVIPAMTACSDVLGIRAPGRFASLGDDMKEASFAKLSKSCTIPLINLESAINHPCQSLADWKTLDELNVPGRGGRLVMAWNANPVAHALAVPAATIHMAAMRGMRVTVLRPPEYALPKPMLLKAQKAAEVSGGAVIETDHRDQAMDGAHALYAESWIAPRCYHAPEKDQQIRERYSDWLIDERWFARAQETAAFFHTLPVRRGVGVTDDVLDGPRSMLIRQSRNRMLVQMAILHRMLAS